MPASTIVASGGQIRLYGDAVQTYDALPVATYAIEFSELSGYSLRKVEDLAPGDEKIYGSHPGRVDRILRGYQTMSRSMGAILSGDKGMGKSLMLRMLAMRARDELSLPTILVQRATPGIAAFLDELGECVIVFDEFEKVFAKSDDHDLQNQFLSLFDGLSTTKRLYVLSVNDLSKVNDFMLNRPGRFHYHMRFAYPEPATVELYLRDQVPDVSFDNVDAVVDFSRRYDINFDHLRAIAFELRLGAAFAEIIGDLNIKRTSRSDQDAVVVRIDWVDGEHDEFNANLNLFDSESLQTVESYYGEYQLRFRMRDALPNEGGFLLRPSALTIVDDRDDEDKAANPVPAHGHHLATVTIRRPVRHSIDF